MISKNKTIKILLSLERSNHNIISLDRVKVKELHIDENEIIQQLYLLSNERYIKIHTKSQFDDFDRYWEIELLPSCVHYFSDKRNINIKRVIHIIWEVIKFAIPTIISIIALLKSYGVV